MIGFVLLAVALRRARTVPAWAAPALGFALLVVAFAACAGALLRVTAAAVTPVGSSPLLTPERLVTLLGVRPEQYPDFAALRGDPSDNLPGVRGFGPRTAARLLTAVGGVREAFDDLDAGGDRVTAAVGPAAAARLSDPAAREAWELNRQVMAMRSDVAIDLGAGHLPFPADEVRAPPSPHWTSPGRLRPRCACWPTTSRRHHRARARRWRPGGANGRCASVSRPGP